MRYLWKDLRHLTDHYPGNLPLAHYLKQYFRDHHRLGSRDRKVIADALYAWCRASRGFDSAMDFEPRMQAAMALCATEPRVAALLPESWRLLPQMDLSERRVVLEQSGVSWHADLLFPFQEAFSEGMIREEWLESLLVQPLLFVRVRSQHRQLREALDAASIPHEELDADVWALPNGAPVDQLWPAWAYVVQDRSSQATGRYFQPVAGSHWHDVCAGAGGKSLLLMDQEPRVELSVSDIRDRILENLRQRFRQYSLPAPKAAVVDFTEEVQVRKAFDGRQFDALICDVPCSGSGTWARTPEQAYAYEAGTADGYARRQLAIAKHASALLKPGGRMFYITCSVFREENEDVVEALLSENTGLALEQRQLINGISHRADSLFIAVLRRKA
jgi:16S rRNA (cytosine967-C5)-methyltransferase